MVFNFLTERDFHKILRENYNKLQKSFLRILKSASLTIGIYPASFNNLYSLGYPHSSLLLRDSLIGRSPGEKRLFFIKFINGR